MLDRYWTVLKEHGVDYDREEVQLPDWHHRWPANAHHGIFMENRSI